MFAAVRHWWSGGRAKVTLRLFFFELFVVVIGVLIAQTVANWAQDRAAVAEMERARTTLRWQIADIAATAQGWQVAAPCLDARLAEVMKTLAIGPLAPGGSDRPSLVTFKTLTLDERSLAMMRERHGNLEMGRIEIVRRQAEFTNARIQRAITGWGRLALADPLNGPTSAFGREQARTSAAEIRGELKGVRFGTADLLEQVRLLGIDPHGDDDGRPIRDCAEMWATRLTWILPEPSLAKAPARR